MSWSGTLLRPLSWLYGLAAGARNLLYDLNLLPVHKARVPVISVGNLTAGGTGKTPLVSYIVGRAEAAGILPAVVGRGYRRTTSGTVVVSDGTRPAATASEAGDELLLLARRHPRAVVIADERRPRGAAAAADNYGAGLIVLDDGFQHRALARDLDIVMIDAMTPLPPMLPAGLRREPVRGLRRASMIVFSNAPRGYDDAWVERYSGAPRAHVRYAPAGIRGLRESDLRPAAGFAGRSCLAFCGIGNPASFRSSAEEAGLVVLGLTVFRDHVRYTGRELAEVRSAYTRSGAELLLTTEKDAVKLDAPGWSELPVHVLAVGLEFLSGADVLDGKLLEAAGR